MEIKTSLCTCLWLSVITPHPFPYYRHLPHDALLTKTETGNESTGSSNEVSLRMKVGPDSHFVAISVETSKVTGNTNLC